MAPEELIEQLSTAAKSGQWVIVVGLALMLLIMAARWLCLVAMKEAIPKKYTALITSGLAVLGSIAAGLLVNVPWWQAILAGLVVGTSASGFWSLLGKHLQPLFKRLFRGGS